MPAKILLVEDDVDQAFLFSQVLEMSGYTVVVAANAAEAQTHLTENGFALLLADWDLMGEMNGDVLINWAQERQPGIKTILFSNHARVDEYAAACHADACFRKIEGIASLRQLVADLLAP